MPGGFAATDASVGILGPDRGGPVRIGIVGLGAFGRLHALTAAGLAEVALVALVDGRQAVLDGLPAELAHVPRWNDLEAALAASRAEAWIVAASTASHVPLTRTLLAAGASVLLEKPIADDLAAASSLAPLVRDDSSNLMLGHLTLFGSEFRQLLHEVRRHGPISFIDAVRHRPANTLDRYPGESPFHLTMVHDLCQVFVLMDGAEPAHLSAHLRRTPAGHPDLALAQLRWEHGAVATVTASFLTPPGMPSDGFDRLEVFGPGWAARLLPNPRPIEVWSDRARWPLPLEIDARVDRPSGMLAEQLRCFCGVVRGTSAVPRGATYADALRISHWIDRFLTTAI